ncbi:aminopeptidase P family protein [Candidatus Gottesmanbacteria bacterium]|nr:aminopeptidase P family protein [Candidatus Gottesmanbacteria bacterium]
MKILKIYLEKIFRELQIEALLITDPTNIKYLTGFCGVSPREREAFALVTHQKIYLLTYPVSLQNNMPRKTSYQLLLITSHQKLDYHLLKIIRQEKINSLGFEKDNITVGEYDLWSEKVKVNWVLTRGVIENLRIIKTEEEIKKIEKAALLTDKAYSFIRSKIKFGVTEKYLAFELENYIRKNGAGIAFPPIVAFNLHSALPHHQPSDTKLKHNSLILIDLGAKAEEYCADMTRVLFYGTPDSRQVKIYETVLSAQKLALSQIIIGRSTCISDQTARKVIKHAGYPEYPHGLGHGVGLDIHEAPRLRSNSQEILQENMVVTVEPGIYLEGICGVRIEDLVVLKCGGIEILSQSPKELEKSIL